MLQLAGKIGNGVLINASHPDDIERAVKFVKQGSDEAGRKFEDIDVAAYTSFSISDDEADARKPVIPVVAYIVAGSPAEVLERHGISPEIAIKIRGALANRNWGEAFGSVDSHMIDTFTVCGTPDICIEKINELFKMGVTQFVTGSPLGPDKKTAINLFGKEVLPSLKE
jgi:5,10-methylenetetrahydromethanopterin reductase